MTIPLDMIFEFWDAFLLVFIRITGLFVISPLFGRRNIPVYYKVGFSFLTAIIVTFNIPAAPATYNSLLAFIMIAAGEFIVGLMLGYISYLILNAIFVAGQMIDMRIGFGMVNVFDPISNIQIPVTANFYFIIAMLMFIVIDGHHLLIYTLTDSFNIIPIGGTLAFDRPALDLMLRLFGAVFIVGFKIAAPVTAAILVTDVALGVISKGVPQVNVFILGMPLKILMGLLVMFITIVSFRSIVHVLMDGMQKEMYNFMELISQ